MPATIAPTANTFDTIANWLGANGATKLAGATTPDLEDGGKPATEGARGHENSADVKKIPPGQNAESGQVNPDAGKMNKPVPDSGLAQGTPGSMTEVERSVKVVKDEAEKMAAADLSTDAGLEAAFGSLQKAAAALPSLLTRLGVSSPTPAPANIPANLHSAAQAVSKEAADRAADEAIVDAMRKYGADRGELTVSCLRGMDETYWLLKQAIEDGSMQQMLAGGAPDAAAGPGGPPAGPAGMVPSPAAGDLPPGADAPPPGGAEGGAPSIDDMAAAMAEAGITPEMLEEIAAKLREQVGGDANMGSEQKAAALAVLDSCTKTASDVRTMQRAGNFRLKPAADGTPERRRRDAGHEFIRELRRLGGV